MTTFKDLMKKADRTQKELASITNKSLASKLMNGKRRTPKERLLQISKFLNCQISELL